MLHVQLTCDSELRPGAARSAEMTCARSSERTKRRIGRKPHSDHEASGIGSQLGVRIRVQGRCS